MAQIFLGNNPKSLAVELISRYTRAVDSDIVKLSTITPEEQQVLGITSLPCLIATEGGKAFKCGSPYAIFRHIAEATRFEKIFLGKNEADNNKILSYFELITTLETQELCELINTELKLRMFLVSFNITAADIFAYAHVVRHVQALSDLDKLAQNNLFRWIDHLQHLPGIDKFSKEHGLEVSFPDESAKQLSKSELKKLAKKQYNADKKAGKQEAHKGDKEKKPQKQHKTEQQPAQEAEVKAPVEEEKTAPSGTSQDAPNTDKSDKKEKKQKQQNPPKNKGNKKAEPEPDVENICKIDMRVGQITKVWKHPDSEKLYCEEIDIGEGKLRQIASGLQQYVPIETMENAMVVVLANLKAKKLAGFESHGMVMCAETPDKSAVELLVPPEGSKIGDLISVKGFERVPPETLNPKKKILESVIEDFIIDENGIAKYKDAEFVTDKGMIVATTIRKGIIR